jgi:hypothetical protein
MYLGFLREEDPQIIPDLHRVFFGGEALFSLCFFLPR